MSIPVGRSSAAARWSVQLVNEGMLQTLDPPPGRSYEEAARGPSMAEPERTRVGAAMQAAEEAIDASFPGLLVPLPAGGEPVEDQALTRLALDLEDLRRRGEPIPERYAGPIRFRLQVRHPKDQFRVASATLGLSRVPSMNEADALWAEVRSALEPLLLG
jgi:hypothetical protein